MGTRLRSGVVACLLGLAVCAHGEQPAASFYVATDGNDANPGTEARPFATLTRARDEIRSLKIRNPQSTIRNGASVFIRSGVYELPDPFVLTPEDSGFDQAPITYSAFPGEKPVISGGTRIAHWRRHDDKLWVADVPWVAERKRPFYQLYVNGVRRTRARTPNAGSYFYSQRLRLTNDHAPRCLGLTYAEGDIKPWKDAPDAVIVLFHNWINTFNYISDINPARRRITFDRPAGAYFLGPHIRYYVENLFEALDAPGEWYLDAGKGALYYYPLPGEDIVRAEVIAPRLAAPIVSIRGVPDLGLYVERLQLRGLSFQHTDADLSRDYPHDIQGAVFQKGAILAVGLRDSVIEDCEFTRLGEHALSLREGCSRDLVTRCHVHDVGGGGIYLSGATNRKIEDRDLVAHNTVDDNFIHDGGYIFRSGAGVFLGGYASYNKISHNEICDMSWIGVHAGWSWTGRVPTYTHHNEVAFNHIHHLGNGVLNDMGGIYTLGVSPGTVLHHNLIHDVTRFERGHVGYGGWGIYLDAGSSEIRVEDNVVYNTRDGGFHAHCDGYPYGDEIVNNVFACSDAGQMIRGNNKEPEGWHVRLERNIVYNPNNRMYQGNWKNGGKFVADSNCYWGDGGEALDFDGRSFAAWKAEGRDAHAIIADPRFMDAARRDFGLRPDSPALKLGFRPIDLSGVGLYGPEDWRRMPDHVVHRAYEQAPPPVEGPLEEDFEEYDVGDHPAGAVEKEGGAEAIVTDLDPASGHRCLRFVDAPDVTAWKPHWCLYRTAGTGKVRMQCSVKNDPSEPATFDLEFRDWPSGASYSTGPHLRFSPDGTAQAAGKAGQAQWTSIGRYDLGKWLRVEIEFEEGTDRRKTYKLRLTESGRPLVEREDLPFRSDAFKACTWVGLSGMDTKRAVFYVDDFRIE